GADELVVGELVVGHGVGGLRLRGHVFIVGVNRLGRTLPYGRGSDGRESDGRESDGRRPLILSGPKTVSPAVSIKPARLTAHYERFGFVLRLRGLSRSYS